MFTTFLELPFELRMLVWQAAFDQNPRLIELEWTDPGNHVTGFTRGTHEWRQVCRLSRKLPVIMEACSESLEEGKRYLEHRMFDSDNDRLSQDKNYKIYFNPRADFILFGERACFTTMINLFSETPGVPDKPIPRIAIMCNPGQETCENHDDPIYGVRGGVDMMQALHGFSKEVTNHDFRYSGCTGLREVHFIVKSKLWKRAQGEIDWRVGLRSATNRGLTPGEIAYKARLQRQIARIEDNYGVPRAGKFRWAGNKRPEFHFSSFAPASTSRGEAYDGLIIRNSDTWKLENNDWQFVRDVQRWTGCKILVQPQEYPGELTREIGFVGSKRAVAEAVESIQNFFLPSYDVFQEDSPSYQKPRYW